MRAKQGQIETAISMEWGKKCGGNAEMCDDGLRYASSGAVPDSSMSLAIAH